MAFGRRFASFGGVTSAATPTTTSPSSSRNRCRLRTDESIRAIEDAVSGFSLRVRKCCAKAETSASEMLSGVVTSRVRSTDKYVALARRSTPLDQRR
jgi:hypothetical protein